MPRFSIKDLMLAMLLVAVGLSVEFTLMNFKDPPFPEEMQIFERILYACVAVSMGGAVIGAGALAPFHKKAVGAGIGFLVGICFVLRAVIVSF